ncbi:MAG: HAD-IA family hydrolase [Actinomycetota bacterium]|nr:HAD-IA family hydrolase [Actinomycetota bacterium]
MKPELLALDLMGVVFEESDVVTAHLAPFAQARGSPLDLDAIRALYKRSSAGEFDAARLWRALGVSEPEGATADYVRLHRLAPGAVPFLEWARGHGIRIAGLSNDVGAWSRALRERHGLPALFEHWVISGDVGSRKPERAIFEALREVSGVPFEAWVFVDDHRANVEAASALGVTAVLFSGDFDRLIRLVADLFKVEGHPRPRPRSSAGPATTSPGPP